jgi:hypothetical protein
VDHRAAKDLYEMVNNTAGVSDCGTRSISILTVLRRLNSKIKARDVQIQDLVKDLSDGVSFHFLQILSPSP